jgi:hypothetical protein
MIQLPRVTAILMLVANYLLCIESFVLDRDFKLRKIRTSSSTRMSSKSKKARSTLPFSACSSKAGSQPSGESPPVAAAPATMMRRSIYSNRLSSAHWPTLTCWAGIWIWEGVFIVFLASIETGEIFLNQECK